MEPDAAKFIFGEEDREFYQGKKEGVLLKTVDSRIPKSTPSIPFVLSAYITLMSFYAQTNISYFNTLVNSSLPIPDMTVQ